MADRSYENVRSCQWWRAKEQNKQPHEMLKPLLDTIQREQSMRYNAYKEWYRSMEQDMSALDGSDMAFTKLYGSELTINEALNTIETLHAQVFKNKIVPAPCPVEGDYEDEFQARALGRWLEGLFDDSRVFEDVVPSFGFDCLTYGTGIIKATGKPLEGRRGKVVFETVSPRFLFVDKQEARHGRPRSIHQKMHIDRWVAQALYGHSKEARLKIAQAKPMDDADFDLSLSYDGDQITIWESWHLPSGPGARDGLRCIWLGNYTLEAEEWKHTRFPFTLIRFGARTSSSGYWGQSAVGRILPAQRAFDKLTSQIDESCNVLGVPRVIIRNGSDLERAQLDDVPFTVFKTNNGKDDIFEWNAEPASPALLQERDGLPNRMKSCIGVSGMESQLQLPANIRDGAAAYMDRIVEQSTARHAMLHRAYEDAMMDLADLGIMIASDLEEAGLKVVVKAPGNSMKTTVEMLNFSDVKTDRENLKLRIIAVSQLPRTFAGKIKDLTILRDRGDITQKTYMRLLEVPDSESEEDAYCSSEDIIKRNLSYMLRKGKYMSPLPYDDLDSIVRITTEKIHQARCRDVDEEKVALLIQYIEDALALKNGVGESPVTPTGGFGPPAGPVPGLQPDQSALPIAPPQGPLPPPMPAPGVPPPPMLPPAGMLPTAPF